MHDHPYDVGAAIGAVFLASQKMAAEAELSYGLKGKLYFSRTGWLLLSVPNALARGAFDALNEQGIEMPRSDSTGQIKAHISVMRPSEIATIEGGEDAINERGHEISYTLGPVRSVVPSGWDDVERVWYIEVRSPELERLRRSYGLSSRPRKNSMRFHITFALRRKHVLRENGESKVASLIHYPEATFCSQAPRRPQRDEDDFTYGIEETETGETYATKEAHEPVHASEKRVTPVKTASGDELAFKAWKARGLSDEAADYRAGVSLELPGDIPKGDIPKGEICPHCGKKCTECGGCGKTGHEESSRIPRSDKLAGIQNLGFDDPALYEPQCAGVLQVRRSGNYGLHKVASQLLGILEGHGSSSEPQTFDRTPAERGRLHATKLLLGDEAGAGQKQAGQSPNNGVWQNADSGGLGDGNRNTGVYNLGQAAEGRANAGGGTDARIATQENHQVDRISRTTPESDRRGKTGEDRQTDDPQTHSSPGYDARGGYDNFSCQRAATTKVAVEDLAGVKELIAAAVKECTTPASEEQAKAGNYKKGHLTVYGIPITIETGKGMTRSGTSKSGKKWSILMKNSYGYIKATESEADGDHIDVFLNDADPIYEKVFVVDQKDPETGDFDEHKVLCFFANAEEAEAAYNANYEKGWKGFDGITEMSLDEFKTWIVDGDTSKPTAKKEKKADLLPSTHLQPQQARIADEAGHQRVRKLLYHSLGSGKGLSSIAAAESAGEPYTAVVPAALRENYRGEQRKWTDMTTPSQVISYNSLAKEVPSIDTGTVVMDESQRLRNENSLQTQNAKLLAAKAHNLLLLSGTPIVNSPGDFAPLAEMLTGQPQDTKTFESTYVGQKTVNPGILARLRGVQPAKEPVLRNQDKLRQLLKGHVDYHAPATPDVEQLEERYTTPMSSQQTKLYQAFWQQLPWMLRWKLQHEFPLSKQEIGNLSSFLSGPRQVSLSTLPFMRGRRDPYKAFQQSPKLQKAFGLAEETLGKDQSAKIVAFSNFLEAGLQPYAAALAAKKIPYAIFHGGMSDRERKKAVEDYNANRIRALLIAPAGSEGISLKGTNTLQLLDPHWNEARLDQAIGRGIRFDSHTHLPPEQRKVRVQRFLSELPPGVLARLWRWVVQTKPGNQMNNPGTDAYLEGMAKKKQGLNDQFLNLLKEIGTPKAAAAEGQSFYLDAIGQTPLQYDPETDVLANIKNHLLRIKARGDRAITEAEGADRLENAADPNRSSTRLQAYLAGAPSVVSHPLDQVLHGMS